MRSLHRCFLAAAFLLCAAVLRGQDTGFTKLSLDNLSAFKPQAGNWQIVGGVTMDPTAEIHPHAAPPPVAEIGKKKKKAKAEPMPAPAPEPVKFEAGTGVLLNMNSETKHDNLISAFDHGDIELELEVMIPKGSNSGIYLQGRYEVQLLDSWGVRHPKFSDIGGIYRNWESEKGKVYMGEAPDANPAKAPGTWQKFKIKFKAPRFDAAGNKIANARFVSVELNGVKIHDNIEVPLPTGGPVDSKETAMGPLMIQGDHGPVAFRNIQYRLMHDLKTTVSPVAYKIYHGDFKSFDEIASATPVLQGTSTDLSADITDVDNAYAVAYAGTITIPESNSYLFRIGFTGGIRLVINGNSVLSVPPNEWRYSDATVQLAAGTWPFEIITMKNAEWMPARLSVTVRTANTYPQTLTAFNSYPPDDDPTAAILINPVNETRLLRAFLDFKGDRRQRLTHSIGVADPAGINYVYDLDNGNLAAAWRGDFVDATPMWHDRGDGSFRPLGAVQYLSNSQPLAFLAAPADPFPTTGKEGEFRTKGYAIEESSGRPVFMYTYQGLEVSDKIIPADDNRSLERTVTLKDRGTKSGLYFKLAEGSKIVKLANGMYSVDQQYFIRLQSSAIPLQRNANGKDELYITMDSAALQFTIIW